LKNVGEISVEPPSNAAGRPGRHHPRRSRAHFDVSGPTGRLGAATDAVELTPGH